MKKDYIFSKSELQAVKNRYGLNTEEDLSKPNKVLLDKVRKHTQKKLYEKVEKPTNTKTTKKTKKS
jgi:hypothetical protein